MTALENQADQKNFLSPVGFKLIMKRAPNIQWFIQEINVPGISTGPAPINVPTYNIPYSGEHLEFETLNMTFKIGEDLADYLEIANWLRTISVLPQWPNTSSLNPTNSPYKTMSEQPIHTGAGIKSDIVLMILNSARVPKFEVIFHDAFPISLSGIDFSSTTDSVDYATASASFKFTDYDIQSV